MIWPQVGGVRELVSSNLAVPTNKHGAFEEIRKPFLGADANGGLGPVFGFFTANS